MTTTNQLEVAEALALLHRAFGYEANISIDVHECADSFKAAAALGSLVIETIDGRNGPFRTYQRTFHEDEIVVYGPSEANHAVEQPEEKRHEAYTEDQFDAFRRGYDALGYGYAAAFKRGCDVTYAQCAAEIADLKAKLEAAYAEDKPTHFPTWSETYAETLPRHGEDEAVS